MVLKIKNWTYENRNWRSETLQKEKARYGYGCFGVDKNLQVIDKENEYVIFVKPDEDNTCIPKADNFKVIELGGGPYPTWEQFALPKAAAAEGCDILHCTSNTGPIKI